MSAEGYFDAAGGFVGLWGRTPPAGVGFSQTGLRIAAELSAMEKYCLNNTPPVAQYRLPPRRVNITTRTSVTLTNLVGPVTVRLPSETYVPGRAAPNVPLSRDVWDRAPAEPVDADVWASARMVELSPPGLYPEGTAIPILGLPPWTGREPLSTREKRWVMEPVRRMPLYQGVAPIAGLATRAQYRESFLVTRAGARPPRGYECEACKSPRGIKPWGICVSGGRREKCNNCLYRGVACSLASR